MACVQQKQIEKFWRWFQKNESKLYKFEANQDRLFEAMATELQKIHKTLTFVFSPVHNDVRELTFSADGIKEGFPYVRFLVKNAPDLRVGISSHSVNEQALNTA